MLDNLEFLENLDLLEKLKTDKLKLITIFY